MRRIAAGCTLACLSWFAAHVMAQQASARPRVPVEDTYVIVPKYAAQYTLARSVNHGDEGQVAGGVALTFRDPASPALSADVLIYPIGGSASVATMEAKFRADVERAQQEGLYTVTQWNEAADYVLRQRDGSPWPGRIMSMRMKLKGAEVDSRTYLFHHGIYAYMVRIDLPAGQGGDLPAVEDALARALLESIQVVSVGGCGKQMTISIRQPGAPEPAGYIGGISPDGFGISLSEADLQGSGKDLVAGLQAGTGMLGRTRVAGQRQIAYGCTSMEFAPPAASDELAVLKLHYPADFWKLTPVRH